MRNEEGPRGPRDPEEPVEPGKHAEPTPESEPDRMPGEEEVDLDVDSSGAS